MKATSNDPFYSNLPFVGTISPNCATKTKTPAKSSKSVEKTVQNAHKPLNSDLKRTMDAHNQLITMTEALNDPEAQVARQESISDLESTRRKLDELTEKFHKVRPAE